MKRCRWVLLAGLLLVLSGCDAGGILGHLAGGPTKKVDVEAKYRGLEGKHLAILVSANEYLLYQYPDAATSVCTAVTNRIAANLPSVTVVPPQQVIAFQDRNPYWTAMPHGELIEKLGVERLVIIDLSEYRTHEPGNAHVWQGYISGDVGVVEAESAANDRMVFREPVSAAFPENTKIGLLNQDEQTIELGMLAFFSRDAAGLFYDHTIEVKR